jgi:hypothetical protein
MEEKEIFKISDINEFKDSESIYFSAWPEFILDLSFFHKLKHLRINNKNYKNIDFQTQLEILNLSPFKIKKDRIDGLTNLKELYIFESDYDQLNFIIKMKYLNHLEIHYFPKLTDLSALQNNDSIEFLQFYSCKNLNKLEVLKSMKKLKRLHLDNMVIPNIDFVKDIKSLNFLSLMGTNVLSGDISPAKDIDFVSIDNRRHYNYRWDDTTRRIYPK